MNGLNNAGIFPYSLNNLQVLSLPDGGSLAILCDVPLIRTLTSTNQEISLFESSPDLIDFDIYDKSLKVKNIFASTGNFSNIYSTGARFFSLQATGATFNTVVATNGYTGSFITANSGTFQNVNTNILTANTINIGSLNIPNLSFNIATGGFLSATGTIVSSSSLRATNGT
ncbi:hypothetical protein EB118_23665, partial [bacterium]|nr:hypothetical protein [bacterium]